MHKAGVIVKLEARERRKRGPINLHVRCPSSLFRVVPGFAMSALKQLDSTLDLVIFCFIIYFWGFRGDAQTQKQSRALYSRGGQPGLLGN